MLIIAVDDQQIFCQVLYRCISGVCKKKEARERGRGLACCRYKYGIMYSICLSFHVHVMYIYIYICTRLMYSVIKETKFKR